MITLETMATAVEGFDFDLEPLVEPVLPLEDLEEEAELERLALEMEIESSMFDSMEDCESEPSSPCEIRSVVQLPGDSQNSLVFVYTKTGRRAKIVLEAEDEKESVGLLQFDDNSQEIRRLTSYNSEEDMFKTPKTSPEVLRLDTLTVPKMGGDRIPSMREGFNPDFDPNELVLDDTLRVHNMPSCRAGKNPDYDPTESEFF